MWLAESRSLVCGLLVSALLGGCLKPQPVDMFDELSNNAPWASPVCPEIKDKNDQVFALRDAQVFYGPTWELWEITPTVVENAKGKIVMWAPDDKWHTYFVAQCKYFDLDVTVDILIPNDTRYCLLMTAKEPFPRPAKSVMFTCVPAPIRDFQGFLNTHHARDLLRDDSE